MSTKPQLFGLAFCLKAVTQWNQTEQHPLLLLGRHAWFAA